MARKKLAEEDKMVKTGFTINKELDEILNDYLEENNLKFSRYIQKLIKEDMERRGYDVKEDFEK